MSALFTLVAHRYIRQEMYSSLGAEPAIILGRTSFSEEMMAFCSLSATGKLKGFTVWFQASFWYLLMLQYYTYCMIQTINIKARCYDEVKGYLDLLLFFLICALIYLYREQQNYQLQVLLFHPPITMRILKQQWISFFSSGPQHWNAPCALFGRKEQVYSGVLQGHKNMNAEENKRYSVLFSTERWWGKK